MEQYITNSNNVLNTIKEYGVAIIPSLLNEDEINNMNNGMKTYGYDYLEYITSDFNED